MNLDTTCNKIHPSVFIADSALVVGDVTIGRDSSVWFNAVVRGDTTSITIGQRCNLQEGVIVHADLGYPTIMGDDVTVGHGAIVHGARVGDGCLIGIRAVLLNGATIGAGAMVGAGAVVTEGKVIPPRSLVLGVPGRIVRELTPDEVEENHSRAAEYVGKARAFRDGGFGRR